MISGAHVISVYTKDADAGPRIFPRRSRLRLHRCRPRLAYLRITAERWRLSIPLKKMVRTNSISCATT